MHQMRKVKAICSQLSVTREPVHVTCLLAEQMKRKLQWKKKRKVLDKLCTGKLWLSVRSNALCDWLQENILFSLIGLKLEVRTIRKKVVRYYQGLAIWGQLLLKLLFGFLDCHYR